MPAPVHDLKNRCPPKATKKLEHATTGEWKRTENVAPVCGFGSSAYAQTASVTTPDGGWCGAVSAVSERVRSRDDWRFSRHHFRRGRCRFRGGRRDREIERYIERDTLDR